MFKFDLQFLLVLCQLAHFLKFGLVYGNNSCYVTKTLKEMFMSGHHHLTTGLYFLKIGIFKLASILPLKMYFWFPHRHLGHPNAELVPVESTKKIQQKIPHIFHAAHS